MSATTRVERELDTVSRQAKRLAAELELPLIRAQSVLAHAVYKCLDWRVLQAQIRSAESSAHVLRLVALPGSDDALAYFSHTRHALAQALAQHVATGLSLAQLLDLLHRVFAVQAPPTALQDVVPALGASDWRSAGIGPDPWAVLVADAPLNGVHLRLVATRAYLPGHYDFSPEHESGHYAEPDGGKLRIVWAEPQRWRQAALDYLDDLDAEHVKLPHTPMTQEMTAHQAWFEAALGTMWHVGEYGWEEEDLLPLLVQGRGHYVVFGYAIAMEPRSVSTGAVLQLASRDDNFNRIVSLHGSAVSVEWIAYDPARGGHPGRYDEYFEDLRHGLLGLGVLPWCRRDDGAPGVLFVKPATDFDVRQALKVEHGYFDNEVAIVLRAGDLELTRELLKKVSARDLLVQRDAREPGGARFYARFDLDASRWETCLRLGFEGTRRGMTVMSNLVPASSARQRGGRVELYARVSPSLIVLVDQLGVRAVDAAMTHHLVDRRPANLLSLLEAPPLRVQGLAHISDEAAQWLNAPLGDSAFFEPSLRDDA